MGTFHPCNISKGEDLGKEKVEHNEGLGQEGGQGKQGTEQKIWKLQKVIKRLTVGQNVKQ